MNGLSLGLGGEKMDRQSFILWLYAEGEGLTLDEIENLESYIYGLIPVDDNGDLYADEITCMDDAREVFYNNCQDCTDLLALRKYLRECGTAPTDKAIYRIFF